MANCAAADNSPPALMLQTVPYDHLMQQLGVSNVRELEDLLISDCFYPKLISGKLDQKVSCTGHQTGSCDVLYAVWAMIILGKRVTLKAVGSAQARALVVEDAVGRDVQPERLPEVVAGLQHWCGTVSMTQFSFLMRVSWRNAVVEAHQVCWTDRPTNNARGVSCRLQQSMGLLGKLEDRIERIHSASEAAAQRQKDQDTQIEEARNQLKSNVDFRNSVCQHSMQTA